MWGVKGTVFQAGGIVCAKALQARKSFSVFKEQKVCKYLWAWDASRVQIMQRSVGFGKDLRFYFKFPTLKMRLQDEER